MSKTKIEELHEKIVTFYTGSNFEHEIQDARQNFFENAGVLDEMAANYELRIAQFLDWYIFDRPLLSSSIKPIVDFLRNNPLTLPDTDLEVIRQMANHLHALFEVTGFKGEELLFVSLFDKKKMRSPLGVWKSSFNKSDIFEGRLVELNGAHYLLPSLCFHSPEVRKPILSHIKATQDGDVSVRQALMLSLLKVRYKYEQFKHINLTEVYSSDSITRGLK